MPRQTVTAHQRAYNNFINRVNRLRSEGYIINDEYLQRMRNARTQTLNELTGRRLRYSEAVTGVQSYDPRTGEPRAIIDVDVYNRFRGTREEYRRRRGAARLPQRERALTATSNESLERATSWMEQWRFNPQDPRYLQGKENIIDALEGWSFNFPTFRPAFEAMIAQVQTWDANKVTEFFIKMDEGRTNVSANELFYGSTPNIAAMMDDFDIDLSRANEYTQSHYGVELDAFLMGTQENRDYMEEMDDE